MPSPGHTYPGLVPCIAYGEPSRVTRGRWEQCSGPQRDNWEVLGYLLELSSPLVLISYFIHNLAEWPETQLSIPVPFDPLRRLGWFGVPPKPPETL